jgi:hypothetical protein
MQMLFATNPSEAFSERTLPPPHKPTNTPPGDAARTLTPPPLPGRPVAFSTASRRHLPSSFTLLVWLCRCRPARSSPEQRALLPRPRISGGHAVPPPSGSPPAPPRWLSATTLPCSSPLPTPCSVGASRGLVGPARRRALPNGHCMTDPTTPSPLSLRCSDP